MTNLHFSLRFALIIVLCLGLTGAGLAWTTEPAAAAPQPVADDEAIYVVQPGDTLSAIARRFGTTVQALVEYNSLSSTTIYVGQRLLLPGQRNPDTIHLVQRGETLYRIAKRYGSTVAAIKAANNLRTDTIYVGQRLVIPGGNNPGGPPPGNPERIRFPSGAASATFESVAIANAPKRYLVAASAGQEMTVNLVTPSAFTYITVLTPDGGNLAGADGIIQNWTGRLPVTGDYTVEVINTAQGAANFSLQVTIVPLGSGPINGAGEAVLERLTVETLESFPVQVQAVISGQLPDGCTYVANVQQMRQGNTFHLTLSTARYANRRCAQVLTPFELRITLETSGLPAGTYSVRLNQISTAFTLTANNGDDHAGDGVVLTPVQYVMAQADIAIHNAPRLDAPVIGHIFGGMVARVTGASVDQQWWRVVCPDDSVGSCWVLADTGSTQPTQPPQ